MIKLDPIWTFVEVVRANGFTAAARRTGIPRSTISLQVRMLEDMLGVRLLKRSTRSLALTDEGQRLYSQASGALDNLAHVLDDVRSRPGPLRGLIRLTAPTDFPTAPLAAAIAGFANIHPDVRFQVKLTNETLDLVNENIDIAIGIGASRSQNSVKRRLMDVEWCFCAATSWIARNGRPDNLQAITDFIAPLPELRRYLERHVLGGTSLPVGVIEVDSHLMARDLMLSGFGVGLLPKGLCRTAFDAGDADAILDSAIHCTTRLHLTFPNRADILPRVRAFADYLSGIFH